MSETVYTGVEVAVVGMAGRFPGARDLAEFWRNIAGGVESVRFFTEEELVAKGLDPAQVSDPNYVRAEGALDDVELFDAAFFGFTPREAEMMDPQHRLFLEEAWKALEHSGYDPARYAGRVGVFAGESANTYLLSNLLPNRGLLETVGGFQTVIGNDRDYLATHVSYKLNLRGPGLTVQTACSTSLVAVHLACQSLLNRECDMALGGGVSVSVPQGVGAMHQEGGIISPDGHCRAFDARARGTVKGSGVGVVVLKRLEDALRDGDTIHAVIKGSAINNDGSLKVGYTAPSVEGQAGVIAEALAVADVEADSIGYVEAHGTGTALGDPIEMAALTEAFRASTERKGFCAVGSLKTNIGHTDAAAGVASLIKAVLALKHRQLPPSLNFEEPNPNIDFASSPFYVNTKLADWPAPGGPRRAGVSSFGIGGTNAHLILEEAPAAREATGAGRSDDDARPAHVLTLSARTETALRAAASNLADYLKEHEDVSLADVAFTLQTGRREFAHRLAVVCRERGEAVASLTAGEGKSAHRGARAEQQARPVVFMFTGQGAQYVSMGRELYETAPVFREHVDACAGILENHLGFDLREVLYPADERAAEAAERLKQTDVTQPALFVVEYALARLWMSWGVEPAAMLGHSIGEYAAACLAGVFSLEDALMLVATRGRLMREREPGAMLAVSLAEEELRPLLGPRLSLAAVNAPKLCAVSGPTEAVEALEQQLAGRDLVVRRLHTSHALHSWMMEGALQPFREAVSRVELRAPQRPVVSSLTGRTLTAAEARDPDYWTRHLRETVRFADALAGVLKEPEAVLLEVGPGQTLSGLVKQQGEGAAGRLALSSMRHPHDRQPDTVYLLNTLARLWVEGVSVDWQALNAGERRRRIPLPTYPFERQRYWIDPPRADEDAARQATLRRRKRELGEYFYAPSWRRGVVPESRLGDGGGRAGHEGDADGNQEGAGAHQGGADERQRCWVIFTDPCGIGVQAARRLEAAGEFVVQILVGEQFDKLGERHFVLNPFQRGGYNALMKELRATGRVPSRILHLWGVTQEGTPPAGYDVYVESQQRGFYSLLALAQELGDFGADEELQIAVVTNLMQEVTGEETVWPEKATVLGPCMVIPLEYPALRCRSIDITLPAPGREEQLAEALIAEFDAPPAETVVAYRGRHRWVQDFEPSPLGEPGDSSRGAVASRGARLRERGVYLLTGGLSDIDLALARHMAEAARARLVMLADDSFPEREAWDVWLGAHDEADETGRRIRALREIEAAGGELLLVRADLSRREQVEGLVARARESFGALDGVVHSAQAAGGGMMQLKTREAAEGVLAPKVQAALTLRAALRDAPPDFFVCFSTSLALTGVFGQVDYCAAGAFLDHFAAAHAQAGPTFYATIDWHLPRWETWQESQMAAVPEIQAQFAETRERFGLTAGEGVEAFRRVLAAGRSQTVVSAQDFRALVAEQRASSGASLFEQLGTGAAPAWSGVRAEGEDYVAPETELEQQVAAVWEELFGIQRISATDNFFEMGGNSLLAIQLVSRLRKELHVELPLNSLFEAPTVAGLSSSIEETQVRAREAEEIERLLREVESLSPEELQATLALELGGENANG